jgi:hypothetical protein
MTFAVLWACNVQAAPDATSSDTDNFAPHTNFLTQVDDVRHSVTLKASELVVDAMGFIGVPYQWGGNSAETGFDCSGFVRSVYQQSIGLLLPRKAEEQASATQKIDKHDLRPGDLVFFNTMRRAFSHVGIYVGEGKFIHSPRAGGEVRLENMGQSYWQERFDGARRVLAAVATPASPLASLVSSPVTRTLQPQAPQSRALKPTPVNLREIKTREVKGREVKKREVKTREVKKRASTTHAQKSSPTKKRARA